MNTKKSPLIFIHKGNIKDNQEYLYDVFKIAKKYNPNTDIYLLGDDTNKTIAEFCGIKFDYFENYSNFEKIKKFEKNFKVIRGKKHGAEEWIKFVFKRWFHIYEFVKVNKIEKFWTFDSDNLIITELQEQEYKFQNYDCTEQCNGACINGFINNIEVINGYLQKINELFEDDFYLNTQIKEFNTINPEYAFTEMRAYLEYKKPDSTTHGLELIYEPENFRSILLQTIIDGETFDPCLNQNSAKKICNCREDSGYEMENNIKKLYFKDRKIFIKFLDTQELVKTNSINMSWVNSDLWKKIVDYIK